MSIRKSSQKFIAFSLALFPLAAGAQGVTNVPPAFPFCVPYVLHFPATPPGPGHLPDHAPVRADLSIALHPQPEPFPSLIVLTPEQVDTLVRQQRLGAQAEAAGIGTTLVDWLGQALQAPAARE